MTTTPVLDFEGLLQSWEIAMRSERKSPQTIDASTRGVRLFLRWCGAQSCEPVLERPLVVQLIWVCA